MSDRVQMIVILGAGLAGAKAAQALREEGFEGRVVLVGEEPERPYERPPLSKEYLRGEIGREKLFVHDADTYRSNEIELLLDVAAVGIDAAAQELELAEGARLGYDRLLIATGAAPRRLDIPGSDLGGIHYLRSLDSSDQLRARLEHGGKVVVVGAGWIGSEAAASARQKGLEVSVIEPGPVPLGRVLGPEVGGVYRDLHREHGVELILGTGVESFEGAGTVERVRTDDGRALDCDFVIVGIGVEPRVDLARRAGLAVEDGVLVDAGLQTSDRAIFAAGDVANHRHPLFGPLRIEHWANALHQGPAAARNMLGREEPYARVPYFFSDQYEVGMEYRGLARRWDQVAFRGDPASREFIAFWLREGRLLAAMNVNVWDIGEAIEPLLAGRAAVDTRALEDPDIPLESLARRPD